VRQLSASFGPIVVDNRLGARSTLGAKLSSGAEPDGDMLLFGSTASPAIASALYKNAGYNPLKSFDPFACWLFLTRSPFQPEKSNKINAVLVSVSPSCPNQKFRWGRGRIGGR
jgi:hypothetical protein